MIIKVALDSDIPIYAQLRAAIIEGIASGKLAAGEALPSVRQLASDLGINLHTVHKTYSLLKQDGFISIHRQKGVVVNPDGPPTADASFQTRLLNELKPLITEAVCRKLDATQLQAMILQISDQFKRTE